MKDIKGRPIVKGDDVLIIEQNSQKVPATVIGLSNTKIKLQLREGTITVPHESVQLQKIVARGQDDRKTSTLLENIFKTTNPVRHSRDAVPGIDLNTLRLFGVGFDNHLPAMRITEDQKKINSCGKVYRLLKEAFDEIQDDEELEDVAEAIAKVAAYLGNKMEF